MLRGTPNSLWAIEFGALKNWVFFGVQKTPILTYLKKEQMKPPLFVRWHTYLKNTSSEPYLRRVHPLSEEIEFSWDRFLEPCFGGSLRRRTHWKRHPHEHSNELAFIDIAHWMLMHGWIELKKLVVTSVIVVVIGLVCTNMWTEMRSSRPVSTMAKSHRHFRWFCGIISCDFDVVGISVVLNRFFSAFHASAWCIHDERSICDDSVVARCSKLWIRIVSGTKQKKKFVFCWPIVDLRNQSMLLRFPLNVTETIFIFIIIIIVIKW